MKRKSGKYLLFIGAIVLVLMTVVQSVLAYEGHTVDIKAHSTIPVTKEARLATVQEIADAKYQGAAICFDDNTVTTWNRIPKETAIAWIVTMSVKNRLDTTMYDVKIHDEFNANVQIMVMNASPNNVSINGNRIDIWNIGTLNAGDTACLTLIIWTKYEEVCVSSPNVNLSVSLINFLFNLFNQGSNDVPPQECKWVYKTLEQSADGKYYLQAVNTLSGINMEWTDANGVPHSYSGGPFLEITVY